MLEKISVVVPIYHGKQYIEQMILQMEECAKLVDEKVELLFVNDDPDEPITLVRNSEIIATRVLETNVNRGIHGARVYGFNHIEGDYILFLDQDDCIASSYFQTQLMKIGDSDAVVCQGMNGNAPIYTDVEDMKRRIAKEYMMSEGNYIVSPGQVLIRREAIPEAWKSNILSVNGADDWFLWLCMYHEDKTFAINEENIYERVIHGENTSLNIYEMYLSVDEVHRLIVDMGTFDLEEITAISNAKNEMTKLRIQDGERYRKLSRLYGKWMDVLVRKIRLEEFWSEEGYKSVAIYGCAEVGKRIYRQLIQENVQVKYFIDRKKLGKVDNISVYSPEQDLPNVDIIILSLINGEDVVIKYLSEKTNAKICSISQIINYLSEKITDKI